MSQVLEKPILLDETGQAIAGKLDTNADAIVDVLEDIKDAIGTSSEFIPVMIKVVTPPTKTLYNVGERLNLSGMVVNLIGTNGVQIDVTQACTFVPANNTVLTAANTSVAITYHYAADNIDFSTSQALTIRALDSIAVTTPPIKTAYQTGETLDLTGIVVTATYSDGYTANVTPDCTFNPANGTVLSSSDTSVTITYTEGGTTKTTTAEIGVKELLSIAVTHLPTKTSYKVGETLDLTGIVVTATYDDTTTLDVTNRCTFSPDDGDTLTVSDTSVAISYTEGSTTKTTSQAITVIELSSIAITTPPTTTEYVVGETLDLTGIVVTATYSDNSTAVITSSCTFSPADGATLSSSDTTITATYTEAGTTKTATQAIVVSAIYGAEWDGTSTSAWTRTDAAASFVDPVPQAPDGNGGWTVGSSPFDTIQPWAGMERVEDTNAGTLVKIPKFYYKWTFDGNKRKLQICSSQVDGFYVSPAHADRGDGEGERDFVYVGAYHCVSTFKSTTGVKPKNYVTPSQARTGIHNLGSEIWQYDFAMYWTIMMLYLVEFADWNSQNKIGYGCSNNDTLENNGACDLLTYHTGRNVSLYYTTGHTRYRYIEDLWGNIFDWCDGLFAYDGHIYAIKNPANFHDSTSATNAVMINAQQALSGGSSGSWVSNMDLNNSEEGFEYALLPRTGTGSATTYICDKIFSAVSYAGMIAVGWDKSSSNSVKTNGGAFSMYQMSNTASENNFGCRLMKLPSNS